MVLNVIEQFQNQGVNVRSAEHRECYHSSGYQTQNYHLFTFIRHVYIFLIFIQIGLSHYAFTMVM